MALNSEFEFAVVEQYVVNYLKRHYWKVERALSYDDVMQEARIMFWQLVRRLTRRGIQIDGPKHLMALFKSSWSRRFITLSNETTKTRTEIVLTDFETNQEYDNETVADRIGGRYSDAEDGYFTKLVEQAPNEIRQVLLLLWTAPAEVLSLVFVNKRTINVKLCELLGYDASRTDLVKAVKTYFS